MCLHSHSNIQPRRKPSRHLPSSFLHLLSFISQASILTIVDRTSPKFFWIPALKAMAPLYWNMLSMPPSIPTLPPQKVQFLEQRLYLWNSSPVWEKQEDLFFPCTLPLHLQWKPAEKTAHILSPVFSRRQESPGLNPSLVWSPTFLSADLEIARSGKKGGGACGDNPVVGESGPLERETRSESITHLASPFPQRARLGRAGG